MVWTSFSDMHSGGRAKLQFDKIWIEAPEDEAANLFEQIFGRDPSNVTCPCCGSDYWAIEYDQPEIQDGHAVVTAKDIANFRGGQRIAEE